MRPGEAIVLRARRKPRGACDARRTARRGSNQAGAATRQFAGRASFDTQIQACVQVGGICNWKR